MVALNPLVRRRCAVTVEAVLLWLRGSVLRRCVRLLTPGPPGAVLLCTPGLAEHQLPQQPLPRAEETSAAEQVIPPE
ncbi:MAG: hypothetical protein RLZZ533_31, partial [Cyanobacteriota bacterium]